MISLQILQTVRALLVPDVGSISTTLYPHNVRVVVVYADQETIAVIKKDLASLEARVDASLHGEIDEMEAAIQEGIRIAREMHSPRAVDA